MKLYQHRTERDAFVTTVSVLAITTVILGGKGGLMVGARDNLSVSGGHCASVVDGGSKCWITETVGVSRTSSKYRFQLESCLLQYYTGATCLT